MQRGLGEIVLEGGTRLPFHAASIANGSRRIAIDASVTLVVAAGPTGRWEATEIAAVAQDPA